MPLRIAQVSAEVTPFAKTGGLGDVVAALTSYLHRHQHDVRLFVPLYAAVARRRPDLAPVLPEIPLSMGPWRLSFSLWQGALPDGTPLLFVHCPALYGREGIYGQDWDEGVRFAFLTRAALVACQHLGWSPQILHVHDWHAALAPLYLRTLYAWDRLFAGTRTVLTLHNLGYQGIFPAEQLRDLGLQDEAHLFWQEDVQAARINFLKTGIVYADLLTTVSRTYAEEIQTPEQGFALDPLLRERRDHLLGIVNGIDTHEWSPESDPHLPATYSADDLTGKRRCKEALLAEAGLRAGEEVPLVGVVSRLTFQKGIDLLFDVLPPLLAAGAIRFVALGSGEARYGEFLRWLASAFPGRAAFRDGYSDPLAHRIEAGADVFLMPSRYEPCGLNQMYSLRYGTVPVVRRTGGLADTVEPFDPERDAGTGFVFEHFTPQGLAWALGWALRAWTEDPSAWTRLMRRGMARDFSWDRQGGRYVDAYRRLLGIGAAAG
jgi:starch synthase